MAPQHMVVFAERLTRGIVAVLLRYVVLRRHQNAIATSQYSRHCFRNGIRTGPGAAAGLDKQSRVRGPQVLGYTFIGTDRDLERMKRDAQRILPPTLDTSVVAFRRRQELP